MRKIVTSVAIVFLALSVAGCDLDQIRKQVRDAVRNVASIVVDMSLQAAKDWVDDGCLSIRQHIMSAPTETCFQKQSVVYQGVRAYCDNTALITDKTKLNYGKAIGAAVDKALANKKRGC